MRQDFSRKTVEILAKRAANKCSNPDCKRPTSGPHSDPIKFINVGVAAHISAASPGGKRYNYHLSLEQRVSPNNGIWLCQTCAHLIDTDESFFSEEKLHFWKNSHEKSIFSEISGIKPIGHAQHFQPVSARLEIVPTRNRVAALAFFRLENQTDKKLEIFTLRIEVNEFAYTMPMGNARQSPIAECDLSRMKIFGRSKKILLPRIIDEHSVDEFSVVFSAPKLDGLFCMWRLDIQLQTNFGWLKLGFHDIQIPSSKYDKPYSFEEFRRDFIKTFKSNKEGFKEMRKSSDLGFWGYFMATKLMYIRHFWRIRGFTFGYMPAALLFCMVFYSGPRNFLKGRT